MKKYERIHKTKPDGAAIYCLSLMRHKRRPGGLVLALLFICSCAASAPQNAKKDHSGKGRSETEKEHHDQPIAEDEHSGHSGQRRAVTRAEPERGIQLSSVAIATCQISFRPVQFRDGEASIDPNSIVRHGFEREIYLRFQNWIRPYPVEILKRENGNVVVRVHNAPAAAEIVDTKANLVRLAYREAFGASGSGHGH